MYTYILWRALQQPIRRNPFYQHVIFSRRNLSPVHKRRRWFAFRLEIPGLLVVLLGISQIVLGIWLLFLLLLIAPIVPLMLFFAGWFSGALLSQRTSRYLALIHMRGQFDPMRVTPRGPIAMTWNLMRVLFWQARFIQTLKEGVIALGTLALIVFMTFGAIGFLPLLLDGGLTAVSTSNFVDNMTLVIVIIAAVNVDLVQSCLVGMLLGGLIPHYIRESTTAQILALGGFLAIQLTTYLIVVGFGFFVLPDFLETFGMTSAAGLHILRLAIFIAIREGIIAFLWWLLGRRFQDDVLPVRQVPGETL